ncbi:hypothetical protein LCI18_005234 [Fusarium solani-melongenae]|uniref:Uncharacterized protein n=1 Tax=Fusarium solani subsp. cucurbitae TaxID=2747967 RepID=A0ACD3YZ83_FUSSC|nr:hypothetical protein LCI18_005234 [Fusarium solani-melongenae]
MLSDFDYRIPQSVGLNHQFVGAAVSKASDEDLHGDDLPRKFLARAKVALHIGKILDAMASPDPAQIEEAETSLHRLGAAIRMDRLYMDGLAGEDLKELRSTLESFSTRWKLGGKT